MTRVVSFRETPSLINAVDRLAKKLGINRSTLIRIGLRILIDMNDRELRGIVKSYEQKMWLDFARCEENRDRPSFFLD